MLTLSEKFSWLIDTLQILCAIPQMPGDEIDYQVYENLDADIRGSFSSENLRELSNTEKILPDILSELESLRDAVVRLIDLRIPGSQIPGHDEWHHVVSRAQNALALVTVK